MATNLRDTAESTLHTVAEFVDDTIHSLQKVDLPSITLPSLPGRRKSGPSVLAKVVGVVAAAAVVVGVLAMLKSRRASDNTASESKHVEADRGPQPNAADSSKGTSNGAASNGAQRGKPADVASN